MGEAVVACLDPVVGEPGVAGIELAPGKARLLHLVERPDPPPFRS
jgi:hypothetical protein